MFLSQQNKNQHHYKYEKSKAMRHLWLFVFVVIFFAGAYSVQAAAGINKQINFQGKVVNSNGTNVANGSYTFVFRMYTVSSGGSATWTETKSLTVTDGIFQTDLGDTTSLPGSVDFNSDNIYLGIEFNSDGEMTPRVHFTAAPYAFNAEKVNGLTVTNTNGTLTIANGETISFGGSFSTSGTNDVAFTTSGATALTLPTTGTLSTLAGAETLTNKTIGSTGLTFSGAATDITTAANESLVIIANGTGVVDIQDTLNVDAITLDSAGITGATNYNGLVITANTGVVTTGTWQATAIADTYVSDTLTIGSGSTLANNLVTPNAVFTTGQTDEFCLSYEATGTTWEWQTCGGGGGMSIGGSITSATQGSILFAGASGVLAQDNTNFFWDDTNNRLGIGGDVTPDATLSVGNTSQFQVNSSGAIAAVTGITNTGTISSTGAIAANGGITFDNSSDTLGAFTAAGTINLGTNLLTNIGANGTSFTTAGALEIELDAVAANGALYIDNNANAASIFVAADNGTPIFTIADGGAVSITENVTLGASRAYTGLGAITLSSGGSGALTLDSASGIVTINSSDYLLVSRANSTGAAAGQIWYDTSDSKFKINEAGTTKTLCNLTDSGCGAGGGVTDDSLDFVKFEDQLDLDASTDVAADGTEVFSVTNTGTGNSFQVNDQASDTTPFIVDNEGRVGIGTSAISANAASERLLQVGSETNRGNTVTYGEVVTKGLKDTYGLTNIKDVYVYDTTADSDGGRWIDWATTDKLSWYNEALDDGPNDACNIATDDRCYSNSFPRKAILVVTSDSLYIFDAQNNNLWMKFSQNASGYALGVDTNNDPSSVTAVNGVIYVGTNGSAAGGLYAIDFTQDRMWNYDGTDRSAASDGIGTRNAAITYTFDNNTAFDIATVGTVADWGKINDVSAAVIQNSTTQVAATVNPRNGITLVALATDSGLTVINLMDQKVLQYSDATDNDYNSVVITRTAKLYGLNEALGQAEMWSDIDDDKVSEVNGTPSKILDELSVPPLTKTAPTILAAAPDALEVVERGSLADAGVLATAAIASSSDLLYVGTNQGLSEVHLQQTAATTWNGWSKLTDTTRQTPLMPATAKAMIPFDDASGNVTDAIKTNIFEPKGTPTYGVDGVRGKAMSFNGTTDYLCADGATDDAVCDVDADFNMTTTGFTITGWFKHSTTAPVTTPDVVFARCYNTTPAAAVGCLSMWMNTTGTMTVGIDDDATWTIGTGSTFDANAATTQTYNDNQWHFFSLSRTNASTLAYFSVDGKLATLTTTAAPTLTLDGSQILGIGTDCSAGAACATGGNLWEGQLDDFTWSSGGATTTDTTTTIQSRKLFSDARPTVSKRTITVTDATTATSTNIGDSGESWIPNQFSGLIVELTSGTGAGQTRRVVSNTATVMTVSPAFTTTPDTTTDFEVEPERLYGASNSVAALGITAESPLGEARMLCAGTNSGTDTGGVTCFNHQAGPNIVAEVFHADAKQLDDGATEWTGTDYDDIQSIDFSGRALVMGSMAHLWTETQDVRLGQGIDYLTNKIVTAQNQILNLGLQTLAGSTGTEVGFTGGADLAENYYSDEALTPGTVVATDKTFIGGANIKKTNVPYQKETLGIVATSPGIVLGGAAENAYPVALSGRVPVLVTNENGPLYVGDRITTSTREGYATKAIQSGRVIGQLLADTIDWTLCEGEDPNNQQALLCATAFVFVNLSDYTGVPVEMAMAKVADEETDGLEGTLGIGDEALTTEGATVRLATAMPTKQENILNFLKNIHAKQNGTPTSEVFTGRVSASSEVITPTLYADTIFAKTIKAESIEGLELFTNRIGSLDEKYKSLEQSVTVAGEGNTSNLKVLTLDSAEVKTALDVLGGLTVGEDATFDGDTVFNKLATFFGITTFKDEVRFEKAPTFNKDTAGFAVIKEGQRTVKVTFEEAYQGQPIVSVTPTNEQSVLLEDEDVSANTEEDIAQLEADFQENFFGNDVKYLITNKHKGGFTIVLNKPAERELIFSWVALMVDEANTTYSEDEPVEAEEVAEEESTPQPEENTIISSDDTTEGEV